MPSCLEGNFKRSICNHKFCLFFNIFIDFFTEIDESDYVAVLPWMICDLMIWKATFLGSTTVKQDSWGELMFGHSQQWIYTYGISALWRLSEQLYSASVDPVQNTVYFCALLRVIFLTHAHLYIYIWGERGLCVFVHFVFFCLWFVCFCSFLVNSPRYQLLKLIIC